MNFMAACIERAHTNSAWTDDTTLLNLTNIGLGLMTVIILLVIACAVAYEVILRAKRHLSFH
jgi:hypothetical protein